MFKQLTEPQKAWLAALRSGEYKQARLTLQHEDSFCCLGVACKVAEKQGVETVYDLGDELEGDNLNDQPKVKQWLGLKDGIGRFGCSNNLLMDTFISSLNDDHNCTFAELADIIEWNADRLFE
jgi:hypothetical protein